MEVDEVLLRSRLVSVDRSENAKSNNEVFTILRYWWTLCLLYLTSDSTILPVQLLIYSDNHLVAGGFYSFFIFLSVLHVFISASYGVARFQIATVNRIFFSFFLADGLPRIADGPVDG